MTTLMAESLTAEQAVSELERTALRHRAVCHPYLEALAKGSHPDPAWALADFARQYKTYSAQFPRFLTALISRLENPSHRALLLSNLTEESGHYSNDELIALADRGIKAEWVAGVPHPELFQRFRLAVAGDEGEAELEAICWQEMLLTLLSQGSAAEAVGALGLGTEGIVSAIYQPVVEAINRQNGLSPRDTVFFPLHTLVDDAHQASLRSIAIDFAASRRNRSDLARGMLKALALRESFWSWLHERAMNPALAQQPSAA